MRRLAHVVEISVSSVALKNTLGETVLGGNRQINAAQTTKAVDCQAVACAEDLVELSGQDGVIVVRLKPRALVSTNG